MGVELRGRRVAILAADGVERVELEQPRDELTSQGARTDLLSLEPGQIQSMDSDLEPAVTFTVDALVEDAAVRDYDLLLLPGGTVNPDKLRASEAAVAFVEAFVSSGKPVAAMCHGPWTLIEAGVLPGRRVTGYPSIHTDLRNAGATVVDEAVVVHDNLITSRSPADLDAFVAALVATLR